MRIMDYLSSAELRAWHRRSDAEATRMVLWTWFSIALVFAGVAWWTNPLTILLGVVLLGGRMLGLAVLMHECGHGTLFATPRLNGLVGQYLCAWPIFADMHRYAKGHARHHRLAGTDRDPDLPNYRAYPIKRESFRRKIVRDLTGRTGAKLFRGRFRRDGLFQSENGGVGFAGATLLFAVALQLAFGKGYLALMWPLAFFTSYMLIARIRQVAEHAGVPDLFDPDPRKNTRTTLPRWWEVPLIAPNFVNYHLEHHLAPGVPAYRLKAFHRFLEDRGVYEDTRFPRGYAEVIRSVVLA